MLNNKNNQGQNHQVISKQNIGISKFMKPSQKAKYLINGLTDLMAQSIEEGTLLIYDPQLTAQIIIQKQNRQIAREILNGIVTINPQKIPFSNSRQQKLHNDTLNANGQKDQAKITSLKQNLKKINDFMSHERKQEENDKKRLEEKAKQFILKMKKEKQEFYQKLKQKESQKKILTRAYSEDTIRKMKQNLQRRNIQKKQQLSQRILDIKKNREKRIQVNIANQINYWQKVSNYHQNDVQERSESAHLLPKIQNIRKSDEKDQKSYKTSKILQMNRLIALQKSRLQNEETSKGNKKPQLYFSKREQDIDDNSKFKSNQKKIQFSFENFSNSSRIMDNINSKKAIVKYSSVKKLQSLASQQKSNNLQTEPQLAVNALNITPGIRKQTIDMISSWNKIIQRIQSQELQKQKGLDILHTLQKKLNKFDKNGITQRMKQKMKTIQVIEKGNQHNYISNLSEQINSTTKSINLQQQKLNNPQEKSNNENLANSLKSSLNPVDLSFQANNIQKSSRLKTFQTSQNEFILSPSKSKK